MSTASRGKFTLWNWADDNDGNYLIMDGIN